MRLWLRVQVHELLGLRVPHLGRDYAGREGWERDPVEHGGCQIPQGGARDLACFAC